MQKKKRTVRIQGGMSQPGVQMAKNAKRHAEVAVYKNRIAQLEHALGVISRGGDGKAVILFVTNEVIVALEALTKTGYWGRTVQDTAAELMRLALRKERFL